MTFAVALPRFLSGLVAGPTADVVEPVEREVCILDTKAEVERQLDWLEGQGVADRRVFVLAADRYLVRWRRG